jgi:hypothetical protein
VKSPLHFLNKQKVQSDLWIRKAILAAVWRREQRCCTFQKPRQWSLGGGEKRERFFRDTMGRIPREQWRQG